MVVRNLVLFSIFLAALLALVSCATTDSTVIDSNQGTVTVSSIYIEQDGMVPATFAAGAGGLSIEYPDACYNEGIEGVVLIHLDIRNDGELINAQIEDGIGSSCDEAAIEMIEEQSFNPAMDMGGESVTARHLVQITFSQAE
ncbi:energy transducer TonB [Rhodohalobacter sp. SW132]|uniref:energy transducer TonB n=1 Tax=Rhodohalobacter sp. SW132 TaxID=2293433 RepID=UPI000E244791|nr:energy transducer TonB [Rhodohalobacter sp. SW132]REL25031.1 energy transducer TonB [Rhodohalobacter sp. SW132]